MIKRIFNKLYSIYNPVKYALSIGVNIKDPADVRLLSANFGSEPYLISIGKHVELSGNVIFITHDGATWVFRSGDCESEFKDVIKYGKIDIMDNCFIGMNTIILPGVKIGPNSIIGSGSVVTKNVPPNCVYAGNPAHFICTLDEYKSKCIQQNPEYSISDYKLDKKQELLRIFSSKNE